MTGGVGVVVGAIIGVLGGGGGALLATRLHAKTTARERERDRAHDTELRDEERRQNRIEQASLAIQLYVNRRGRVAVFWAKPTHLAGDEEPTLPPVSEEAETVASLYASVAVIAALREFDRRWAAFHALMTTYNAGGRKTSAVFSEMTKQAPLVSKGADNVLTLLRKELGASPRGERVSASRAAGRLSARLLPRLGRGGHA